jgi:YARHG domain
MKRFVVLVILSALFSCKKESDTKLAVEKKTVTELLLKEDHQELYGSWVGEFIAEEYDKNGAYVPNNKINILLKSISGENVTGISIVAGNLRNLKGQISNENGELAFILHEPGDNKYDGTFDFKLKNDTLVGSWMANDKNIAVTKRIFKLTKTVFVYNANLMLPIDSSDDDESDYTDYYNTKKVLRYQDEETGEKHFEEAYRTASDMIFKLNGSSKRLSEEKLKELKKIDLEIIRNTIFARHGYTFKKKTFRQFFDYVDWYVPISDDVSSELTPLEKDNIALLKKFEKYAEDNYDTFGR